MKQLVIPVFSVVLLMSVPMRSFAVNTQCGVDFNARYNNFGENRSFVPNYFAFSALKADGSITAWGDSNFGGGGAPTDAGYVSIVSSHWAFAALKADGSITAWGDSNFGGGGAPTDAGYISIASTDRAFAAMKADGSITAWGDSRITAWGYNYGGGSGAPTDAGYISIASTGGAFAAMKADGSITAWGYSSGGGSGAPTDTDYTSIVSNSSAFAALKADGSITAWGNSNRGGSGVPPGAGYISIASVFFSFAALKADGSITIWGLMKDRIEENGSNYIATPADSGYIVIASNGGAFAAMKADGSITSWGWIGSGGSGAPSDAGYTSIVSNSFAFAAMKADGSIATWGNFHSGGNNGAPTDSGYISIASTSGAFAAMKADGSITAWGNSTEGGIGAPTDAGYVSIASTHSAFAAMKADGSITAWGNVNENFNGESTIDAGIGAPIDEGYISINGVGPNTPTDCSFTLAPKTENNPKPSIITSNNDQIAIGMDSGNEEGTNSDWWLVANTPSGLFSYNLDTGSWVPGTKVTYQNALFSFGSIDLLNISDLPQGTNIVYFGVDLLKNAVLDIEQAHYDSVEVTVSNSNRSGTVYILLHGYNSSVNGAWTDLVTDNAFESRLGDCENNKPFTTEDVYITDSEDLADLEAKDCYAYEYNTSGIWENGDGSTYPELRDELKNLVDTIDNVRRPANIMFITHSKGGLNLRAYLQNLNASQPFKIGMLTIDTPHQGSPLGRAQSRLVDHGYEPADIPTQDTCPAYVPNQLLRIAVMSPATSYLAQSFKKNKPVEDTISTTLWTYINNNEVGSLGDSVDRFGQITSAGIYLGDNYALGFDFFPHPSEGGWIGGEEENTVNCIFNGNVSEAEDVRNYVFENLTDFYPQGDSDFSFSIINAEDWIYGDGIVPETSQRLDLVPGFTSNGKPLFWTRLDKVTHTQAKKRTADIQNMLDQMEASW